jgi:hypothetical protein
MFLEIAGIHGLSVYAGFEVFEQTHSRAQPNKLLQEKPEWFFPENWTPARAVNEQEASADEPRTLVWLSPFDREARRFLGALTVEVLEAYPFEGIYLDQMTLPSALPETPDDYQTNQLLKRWGEKPPTPSSDPAEATTLPDPNNETNENLSTPSSPEAKWNQWLEKKLLGFCHYLRQRLYKVRPHLIMMTSVTQLRAAPNEPALSVSKLETDNPAAALPQSTDRVEVYWKDSLDQLVEIIAPRFTIRGKAELANLAQALDFMGEESPVLPILRIRDPELYEKPFHQIRDSSVLGFMIDTGRPLLEKQWAFFADLFDQAATPTHVEPADAVQLIIEETTEALSPDHPIAAVLGELFKAQRSAEEGSQEADVRMSVINNLLGLIKSIDDGKVEFDTPEAAANCKMNIGLLIRLESMLHSRGQLLRATPYFS